MYIKNSNPILQVLQLQPKPRVPLLGLCVGQVRREDVRRAGVRRRRDPQRAQGRQGGHRGAGRTEVQRDI